MTAETTPAAMRLKLAELISVACDREVSAQRIVEAADVPLTALGVGSLARLRLIDGIEDEFGLFVEADDIFDALENLTDLTQWLCDLQETR